MKNSELVQEIARRSDLPKAKVAMTLDCLAEVVQETLSRGDGEVTIAGLGKLVAKYRAPREARNPATGETVNVPAKVVAQFKAVGALRNIAVRT